MSEIIHPFELPGAEGEKIIGFLHLPAGERRVPVVLLAHGYTAWCGWGFLPGMASALANAGLGVLRFSFSHCGVTGEGKTYERPELFERDTFAFQVFDTMAI